MILVSACLLGRPVRYNGKGLRLESDILHQWQQKGLVIPLCPEVAAGFPTPRPPAEIKDGDGVSVLAGNAAIIEDNGSDVTAKFLKGAELAVETALKSKCRYALLTDGSPSCGTTFIYNGNHDGRTRPGNGVVAAALEQAGVKVFSQHQIEELDALLDK